MDFEDEFTDKQDSDEFVVDIFASLISPFFSSLRITLSLLPLHQATVCSLQRSTVFVCLSKDLSLHSAAISGRSKFLLFSRNEHMSRETLVVGAGSILPLTSDGDLLERWAGSLKFGAENFSSFRYNDCVVDILSGRHTNFSYQHRSKSTIINTQSTNC